MLGHGHVTPNPDGSKARCGGPRICAVCAREAAPLPASAYQAIMISEREGVSGCARCGGTHGHLDWKPFARPVPSDAGQYTAWAMCPTSGDPIMFEVQQVEDEAPA
jgi:hypothetical protein